MSNIAQKQTHEKSSKSSVIKHLQRPERPACMNILRWTKKNWGAAEKAIEKKYLDDLRAWEEKTASTGRSYPSNFLSNTILSGHNVLLEWLRANAAPEEVVYIASTLMAATIIRYHCLSGLDDLQAMRAAEIVPNYARATRIIRKVLKTSASSAEKETVTVEEVR